MICEDTLYLCCVAWLEYLCRGYVLSSSVFVVRFHVVRNKAGLIRCVMLAWYSQKLQAIEYADTNLKLSIGPISLTYIPA
jgi:hypothetical protein